MADVYYIMCHMDNGQNGTGPNDIRKKVMCYFRGVPNNIDRKKSNLKIYEN